MLNSLPFPTILHCEYILGSIIFVKQLDCIVLHYEVASDYVAVRDAIEEAIIVAMSKHKLSENEKPVRAFYCSCGRGKRHAAEATWFESEHQYISTCTIDYKSLNLLNECIEAGYLWKVSWFKLKLMR